MRALVLAGLLLASGFPGDEAKWRSDYEAKLRAPDGWLTLVGLHWLQEGPNALGQLHGDVIRLTNGIAAWEPKSGQKRILKPDDGPPDKAQSGNITVTIVKRGGKLGARLRDPDAATRKQFRGVRWFPLSEAWRVSAKWVPYPQPKRLAITNILGMTGQEPSPGYAEFTVKGTMMRLEPVTEDNELFFLFRDKTNSGDTYGAGRFLYADMPRNNRVELDFNKAHNPPCAFTPYATCPLPPRQNTLPIAIEAGEKRYSSH